MFRGNTASQIFPHRAACPSGEGIRAIKNEICAILVPLFVGPRDAGKGRERILTKCLLECGDRDRSNPTTNDEILAGKKWKLKPGLIGQWVVEPIDEERKFCYTYCKSAMYALGVSVNEVKGKQYTASKKLA